MLWYIPTDAIDLIATIQDNLEKD